MGIPAIDKGAEHELGSFGGEDGGCQGQWWDRGASGEDHCRMKKYKAVQVFGRSVLHSRMCLNLPMSKSLSWSMFLFLSFYLVVCQQMLGVRFSKWWVVNHCCKGKWKIGEIPVLRRKGTMGSIFCNTLLFSCHNIKKFLVC